MNKRRLLKLADLLDADAKNKKGIQFDMRSWGEVDDPENPISCGTQACAMGLAALSGAFKRAGLEADIEFGMVDFRWKRRYTDGFSAARKLFEIDDFEAEMLFGLHRIMPREGAEAERAKAKQIRKFVKTGKL
jgi:hypothetical protein